MKNDIYYNALLNVLNEKASLQHENMLLNDRIKSLLNTKKFLFNNCKKKIKALSSERTKNIKLRHENAQLYQDIIDLQDANS